MAQAVTGKRPVRRRAGRAVAQGSWREDDLRLAAIDVGSNSIHMVVAQVESNGGITVLWRQKEMVGLGRRSFPSRRLSQHAMDRAAVTLRRFVEEAQRRQCEQVLAVATSAVREAENGGAFIERVRRELGLHIRVVGAKDEARLIYLGARHAMDLGSGEHLLIDIGGGSVEFVVADSSGPLLLESRKLGAARMTARFVKSDPVAADELRALLRHYDEELSPIVEAIRAHKPTRVLGSSGTFENLMAMCGSETSAAGKPILRSESLRHVVGQLLESRSEERAHMRGLDNQRKDQVLAGALLAQELCDRLEIKQIELCRGALREGILIDYLAKHRPELQVRREIHDPRRRAVFDLGRRCHWQRDHSEQVARLCLRLFDETRRLHRLGRRERELIEYGALLHDIGSLIGQRRHHKHSMYLILHGDLKPFTDEEIAIIAGIARYHRKAKPKTKHPEYNRLSVAAQRVVRVGAGLLRIADGLDRCNCAAVNEIKCRIGKRRLDVRVHGRDTELEVWSARTRSALAGEVFGRTVTFTPVAG